MSMDAWNYVGAFFSGGLSLVTDVATDGELDGNDTKEKEKERPPKKGKDRDGDGKTDRPADKHRRDQHTRATAAAAGKPKRDDGVPKVDAGAMDGLAAGRASGEVVSTVGGAILDFFGMDDLSDDIASATTALRSAVVREGMVSAYGSEFVTTIETIGQTIAAMGWEAVGADGVASISWLCKALRLLCPSLWRVAGAPIDPYPGLTFTEA